jgi:hypothetical protein
MLSIVKLQSMRLSTVDKTGMARQSAPTGTREWHGHDRSDTSSAEQLVSGERRGLARGMLTQRPSSLRVPACELVAWFQWRMCGSF